MQVFWTVFAGVFVYVLGQIFVKFFLEPIQEFYKLTGEIGHSLIFYANVFSNPDLAATADLNDPNDPYRKAHETLRGQSAELFAKTHTIPLFGFWSLLHLLPKRCDVVKAGGYLIGLSNGCFGRSQSACEHNERPRRNIEQLLKLETESEGE